MEIEKALEITMKAHEGILDKAGVPYVLHPMRVAMSWRVTKKVEVVVALLHDVVEDSKVTFSDLEKMGMTEEELEALDCLTRGGMQEYEDYIGMIKKNAIARVVKLADLEDNIDIRRLPVLEEKDLKRLVKYHKAWKELTKG